VLGTMLFERAKRRVMLTSAGREMIALAGDVIARLDDLSDAMRGAGEALSGALRMGVIPTIGPFLLPRVLPGLRKNYPELQLYLREEQTAALLERLGGGALDVVLMALPYDTDKLESHAFADDPLLAVFPRGHELAAFETLTPVRMAGAGHDPLLVLEAGNCLTDQTLAIGNFANPGPASGFEATSLHTLVQMVDNGLGVTVLPKMAIDSGILRGLKLDFRPFSSPRAARRIALVWRKSSRRSDEFRLLADTLRDELGTPVRG